MFPFSSLHRAVSLVGVFVLPLLTVGHVHAEEVRDEILRRDLSVIQTQLAQIDVVVKRIEARQATFGPTPSRFYLDTRQLRDDLERIAEGIDGYLAPPRLPPRQPFPLSGDYLEESY